MPITITNIGKNIYKATFTDFTEEELAYFITDYKNIYNNSTEKLYFMFCTLSLSNISPRHVLKLTLFIENMKPIHRTHLEKFAMIVYSKKILNILNGVFAVVKPVRPYKIVNTYEEASTYINDS
jgi:hypothetical protein